MSNESFYLGSKIKKSTVVCLFEIYANKENSIKMAELQVAVRNRFPVVYPVTLPTKNGCYHLVVAKAGLKKQFTDHMSFWAEGWMNGKSVNPKFN